MGSDRNLRPGGWKWVLRVAPEAEETAGDGVDVPKTYASREGK